VLHGLWSLFLALFERSTELAVRGILLELGDYSSDTASRNDIPFRIYLGLEEWFSQGQDWLNARFQGTNSIRFFRVGFLAYLTSSYPTLVT
jgi:hypothetical protein